MIKPIYGAASIGVVRVDSKEQLEKTYIRVQEEMSGAKIVDGALVQGTHPNEGVSCHRESQYQIFCTTDEISALASRS